MVDPQRPAHRRPTVAIALAATALVVVALVAAGCSSGDDATSGSTTTTAAHGSHADDSHTDDTSGYGSHGMEPKVATVADIAALGPGPKVGETFRGSIGLNVCGRFLEPPAASTPQDGSAASGIVTDGQGEFTVSPPTKAVAGHAATIGELARQAGIELSSGKVTFGTSTVPAQIDVAGASTPVAGATFDGSTRCGDTAAEVQLWVYPKASVASGDDVRAVVVDPQDTPVVEDGMAFVIAVTPESSLPTLPPSALLD